MVEFEYPLVFLLILFFIAGEIWFKPKMSALIFPNWMGETPIPLRRYDWILKWIGIICILTALASPVQKEGIIPRTKPGHAIMLVMDASQSMEHGRIMLDGQVVDKFTMSKVLASDFIDKRKNDHVGIVVFGDFAYVASPLTFDTASTSRLMRHIDRQIAGRKTAIYDGIFIASRMVEKSNAKEKIAIVLTDGEDTASKIPMQTALRAAKNANMKVYTIGIGYSGDFDEKVLKKIAKESGGKFFQAQNPNSLYRVYEAINNLETSQLKEKKLVQHHYFYQYPLFVGLLSLVLFIFFKERRL